MRASQHSTQLPRPWKPPGRPARGRGCFTGATARKRNQVSPQGVETKKFGLSVESLGSRRRRAGWVFNPPRWASRPAHRTHAGRPWVARRASPIPRGIRSPASRPRTTARGARRRTSPPRERRSSTGWRSPCPECGRIPPHRAARCRCGTGGGSARGAVAGDPGFEVAEARPVEAFAEVHFGDGGGREEQAAKRGSEVHGEWWCGVSGTLHAIVKN